MPDLSNEARRIREAIEAIDWMPNPYIDPHDGSRERKLEELIIAELTRRTESVATTTLKTYGIGYIEEEKHLFSYEDKNGVWVKREDAEQIAKRVDKICTAMNMADEAGAPTIEQCCAILGIACPPSIDIIASTLMPTDRTIIDFARFAVWRQVEDLL